MLIYSGLKSQFDKDVLSGMIGAKIEHAFYSRGLTHNNDSEFASWENSLREMREALREKNEINNKARMIAGYCYEWISKNNPELCDIILPYGFEATWNYNNTTTWAIDAESFDQVGCIHTSQGLEFDYVGVIIGQDLRYFNGRVITDDCTTDADSIIRNTYKTLLTRGQKVAISTAKTRP